jgi:RimJ/RimL family protein N-acetyltransferase
MEPFSLAAPGLLLRPWRPDDAPDVHAALRDPAMAQWNPADRPEPDAGYARQWVAWRGDWSDPAHVSFAVVDPVGGGLLGSVALFRIDRVHANAETGYWTVPAARGRGVASTALDTLTRWALSAGGLHRVQLFHAVDNAASCRVAAKAGFRLEGTLRESFRYGDGALHDEHLHGRLATDPVPSG